MNNCEGLLYIIFPIVVAVTIFIAGVVMLIVEIKHRKDVPHQYRGGLGCELPAAMPKHSGFKPTKSAVKEKVHKHEVIIKKER